MDKQLKTLLKHNFPTPLTQHKEQFINSISYPKASFCEVVVSQISFIRKRIWFSFMLGVFFAFFYTQFMNVPENIVAGVSAILPLFSLCTVAEIYKSTSFNMEEMEFACKYNLTKVMLMRIAILGTVSFIMLVLLVLTVVKSDFGTFRNIIYLSVPYLLSSYTSLVIISKIRSKETIYICAAISGAVSISAVSASSNYQFIYDTDFTFIWVTLFILLVGLLFYGLIRFAKLQEELQWNLS